MPKKKLFEDDGDDDNVEHKLSMNKSYAENYEKWRRKEDYEELKAKYGEDAIISGSDSDSSSSDENLIEPDNPDFDMDFFRVLAAVRLKHPVVNEERKFFKDSYRHASCSKPDKKYKPLTVKDYERKMLLERGGRYDEDDDLEAEAKKKGAGIEAVPGPSKQTFTLHDSSSDDDDGQLFVRRPRSTEEEEEQEKPSKQNDAVDFLLGKKKSLASKLDEELLTGLKQQWHSDMSGEDKYLMDYFVNQRYLEPEDDAVERAPNHAILDVEPLEEDEKTFDRMQEYETKYRFRFEEPDQEFIRRHPRVVDDAVRKKDPRRKELRERRKDRQELEKERREQELKRLAAWKQREILDKIDRLKKTAGLTQEEAAFEGIDLDADFDPAQHDSAMANMFGDSYYSQQAVDDADTPHLQDEELDRELQEEYKKLEQLDTISEGTFKYADVFANNYGLTTEEILFAKDKELNRWYSLRNMRQYESNPAMEKRELKNYAHRATLERVKAKILPSLYTENVEEHWEAEEERRRKRNLKKKERKLKKQLAQEKDDGEASSETPAAANIEGEAPAEVAPGDPSSPNTAERNNLDKRKAPKRKRDALATASKGEEHPKKRRKEPLRGLPLKKRKRDKRLKGISDTRLAAYGQDPQKAKSMFRQDAVVGNRM